jgi:hypothetical protein
MAKSPGFWFFTGDWLKDPELRFCSIFARGLLVDLLCICFEAKHQGRFCRPDGSPRSDEEIVAAVSGGDLQAKLQALRELESSGVLSRGEDGVLYSRRMVRLANLQANRKQSGSKGGSKTQAKVKQTIKQSGEQTIKQNDKQNGGVSDSDSDSDSFLNTYTHTLQKPESNLSEAVQAEWHRWEKHLESRGINLSPIARDSNVMDLLRLPEEKQLEVIRFSIQRNAAGLIWSGKSNGTERHMKHQRQAIGQILENIK